MVIISFPAYMRYLRPDKHFIFEGDIQQVNAFLKHLNNVHVLYIIYNIVILPMRKY